MIADLYNVPNDQKTLSWFSFANNDAHVLATRAIYVKSGILLPTYPLDPIPPTDFEGWLYNHQAGHNAINGYLGVVGNDLTDVDPRQADQWASWIELHVAEHISWGQLLGYG